MLGVPKLVNFIFSKNKSRHTGFPALLQMFHKLHQEAARKYQLSSSQERFLAEICVIIKCRRLHFQSDTPPSFNSQVY